VNSGKGVESWIRGVFYIDNSKDCERIAKLSNEIRVKDIFILEYGGLIFCFRSVVWMALLFSEYLKGFI
jgi:hypothetical protein